MPVSSFEIATTAAPYFGDERQHALHLLVLARDGVDERLALVDGETGLERLDDRGVDAERYVGDRLDELDRLAQDARLVCERNAGVDVEHLRAGLDLRDRVGDDGLEIAVLHLLGKLLAAGRVDALADDHERAIEADHDLLRRRGKHGLCHAALLFSARANEPLEPLVGVLELERGGGRGYLGFEVVAAGRVVRRHSSRYASLPINPARIAAASIAS